MWTCLRKTILEIDHILQDPRFHLGWRDTLWKFFFFLVFPTLKAIIVAIWPSCWSFNSSDWVLYDIDVSPELTSNSFVQTQGKNNISQCNRRSNLFAVWRVKKTNPIQTAFMWFKCNYNWIFVNVFQIRFGIVFFFHSLITLTCGFRYWVINEWTSERFLIKHAWMCKQN